MINQVLFAGKNLFQVWSFLLKIKQRGRDIKVDPFPPVNGHWCMGGSRKW